MLCARLCANPLPPQSPWREWGQRGCWREGGWALRSGLGLTSRPPGPQKGPLDLIETGKGLKVQTDKPHLVSLGSGRLSTAITLVPLEEGKSGPSVRTSLPWGPGMCWSPSAVCWQWSAPPGGRGCHPPVCFPGLCLPDACPLWLITWLHDKD